MTALRLEVQLGVILNTRENITFGTCAVIGIFCRYFGDCMAKHLGTEKENKPGYMMNKIYQVSFLKF